MSFGLGLLLVFALFAFAIGLVAGLRSFTAPAVVAWAAHLHWLPLGHSPLAFLGSAGAVGVLTVLAFAELVADKLPKTPSRTAALGLVVRFLTGALSGAAIVAPAQGPAVYFGALLGAVGGIVGAFAGYQLRTRLVQTLKVPDFVIAALEDLLAIGGGLFLVSRL